MLRVSARQRAHARRVLRQDKFIFRVEGTGVLPAEDVVATAMDVLIAKLRNLQAISAARACSAASLHPVLQL